MWRDRHVILRDSEGSGRRLRPLPDASEYLSLTAWGISLGLLLRPFRRAFAQILALDGGGEVHVIDVRQRAEPRDHVGEFFFEILAVVARQRAGQFADLLGEMEPRSRRPASAVGLLVSVGD